MRCPPEPRLQAGRDVRELARAIRRDALEQIHRARSGHPGGSLSCAEILAVLYGRVLRDGRDRFVLSKGHAAPALYAAWANTGRIPRAELAGFRQAGARLQGHPHVGATPLAETSTGSLGQGFAVAVGMALGLRLQARPGNVYALLGDGELQEGLVWEAAMSAGHHRAGNLVAIVDANGLQSDAAVEDVMGVEPLADKWRAFRWTVREVDGHDCCALEAALAPEARAPVAVLARTVKGKGVAYMESVPAWHGSVTMSDAELERALADL